MCPQKECRLKGHAVVNKTHIYPPQRRLGGLLKDVMPALALRAIRKLAKREVIRFPIATIRFLEKQVLPARLRISLKRAIDLFRDRAEWKECTGQLRRGYTRNQIWQLVGDATAHTGSQNPLRDYFNSVQNGPGIWKWDHYFDIYHRHFEKFRGKEVNLLEIGIYSGGSLGMWREYFGPKCRIYGVDIEQDCKAYEGDSVTVFIGDQADRNFWRRFKEEVPTIDIVIDDGGHEPDQQIVTLEEVLPHLRPGGVYVCEDVHSIPTPNRFLFYVDGFSHNLHDGTFTNNFEDNQRRIVCKATEFQSTIHSVHLYPFVVVIEKRETLTVEFVSPKHGTEWQPFLR
jgi:hypothetical protein